MMFFSKEVVSFSKKFLISQYVAATIIGFVFGALNILFQYEKLGILKATIIHFLVLLLVYIPCANWAGWFRSDITVIISTMVIFITIYSTIWLICYFQWKKDVEEINTKLKLRKES